jgi:alpha-galactosidase
MNEIHNDFLQFSCEPEKGCFNLYPSGQNRQDLPQVIDARMGIRYVDEAKTQVCLRDSWTPIHQFNSTVQDTRHGPTEIVEFLIEALQSKMSIRVLFGLPKSQPFLIWKVEIRNNTDRPLWIEQIDLLKIGDNEAKNAGTLSFPGGKCIEHMAFHTQGWQSWSWTATYGTQEAEKRSRLKWIQSPLYANPGTPQPRKAGNYAADFFGIMGDRQQRTAILAGFLSQREQFGTVTAELNKQTSLRVWANCDSVRLDLGESLETDWAFLMPFHVDVPGELDVFFEAAALENDIGALKPIPAGWCSWYGFYQNISEDKIEKNLEAIEAFKEQLPLGLIQIDDGFEHEVGDWLTFRDSFPHGVRPLAGQIKAAGYQAGLWLAPFIVHPKSDIYKQKPQWLLRNRAGRPVNAGFIWDVFTTALDLTHPEVMDYVCKVIDTAVNEWGFTYLKLDFLYAAVVNGSYRNPKKTRAQVLRNAFERIREAAGTETTLLACGCPIGSALGLFDAMRIGADVSGTWKPSYGGLDFLFAEEPNMPSARNAIQNVLTRAPMHLRWFINDPDCLIVRESSKLNLDEIRSLATVIAVSGGSLLLSDNLPALSAERREIACMLIPTCAQRPIVLDWFDQVSPERARVDCSGPEGNWTNAAIFNWQDAARCVEVTRKDLDLNSGTVIVRSFWDGDCKICGADQPLFTGEIPAHGCVLLSIREVESIIPRYAGGSLHFSQGMEIQEWRVNGCHLSARLGLNRTFGGMVDIRLPAKIKTASWKGYILTPVWQSDEITRLHLPEGEGGLLEITWG